MAVAEGIDQQARDVAAGKVAELNEAIDKVVSLAAWFGSFVEEAAPVAAQIGANAEESRAQIPAIRRVIEGLPDLD